MGFPMPLEKSNFERMEVATTNWPWALQEGRNKMFLSLGAGTETAMRIGDNDLVGTRLGVFFWLMNALSRGYTDHWNYLKDSLKTKL